MSTIFSHTLQCEKPEMAFHISYMHTWRVDILVLICLYDFLEQNLKENPWWSTAPPFHGQAIMPINTIDWPSKGQQWRWKRTMIMMAGTANDGDIKLLMKEDKNKMHILASI